jgi:hypothetical protein
VNQDVAGLVERLDDGICDDWCKVRDAKSGCTCAEIASTIRALVAENERLRAEKDEFWKLACDNNDFALKQQFKAEFTEAKLREAVKVMEKLVERANESDDSRFGTLSATYVRDNLRAFLATMEKPRDP